MSAVEKNWQTTRATIRERSKFIFANDLFTDVKFVVPKANGESESKQVISAHKLLLSISSPVFEAMFYGSLAETTVWRGILDKIVIRSCPVRHYIVLHDHVPGDTISYPRCCPIVMAMPLCRTTCCYIVPDNAIS